MSMASVRNWFNEHRLVTAALILGAVAGAGLIAAQGMRGPNHFEAGQKSYFVDEKTGEISVHPYTDFPPIILNDGQTILARGAFFSGDGGKTKRLMYLEKYSPEAKAAILEAGKRAKPGQTLRGLFALGPDDSLIRAPEPGSPWYSTGSRQGQALRQQVNALSGDGEHSVVEVYPQ